MVMKVLDKKLYRMMRKAPGQSIAIIMVVMSGTACFIMFGSG